MSNYLQEDARLIRAFVSSEVDVPEASDSLFLLYAVLMRAKGRSVTNADVHDAWAAWMFITRGEHPAIVPYEDLEPTTQQRDAPFTEAIRRAARGR